MIMSLQDLITSRSEDEFLVNRDVYRNQEIFEWEMKYIFERSWNLLGLESQIPKPFDYFTTHIGRTPVIVSRDGKGEIHCLINSCRHKGAVVCHNQKGNSRSFVCQYHGWAYDSSGKNILIKDEKQGGYPSCFNDLSHNLMPVAK